MLQLAVGEIFNLLVREHAVRVGLPGVGLNVVTGEGAAIDKTRPEGRLIFGVCSRPSPNSRVS